LAINTLQVAWLSRLAKKNIIKQGDSIVELGPQDILCSRPALNFYGQRHCDDPTLTKKLDEIYDDGEPRPILPSVFYSIFGTKKYRSVDLFDPRSDWMRDCNYPFKLPERFNIVTNFGTAEHVFNIGSVFRSIHDALLPDGVALHVLPAFGDIDHGFFNVHPTVYLDLATANNYTIDDLCYVDRWDIRNKVLEADPSEDFDFDALPIKMEHLRDRPTLQRMVTDLFVANYNRADTRRYGVGFDGIFYDYCLVALRKNGGRTFRNPVQGLYGRPSPPAIVMRLPWLLRIYSMRFAVRAAIKRFVFLFLTEACRKRLIHYVRSQRK
jgi:SAM-dependent methyltransferase